MRLRTLTALVLWLTVAFAVPPICAQVPSDAALETLNSSATLLYQTGKYSEAIPLAEHYATGTKERFGENSPRYAIAINNLAVMLQAANRPADAEPL